MITETLKGPAKYTAITRMGIADKISQQQPKEIAMYTHHEAQESIIILACRIPWNVDGWIFKGKREDREAKAREIERSLQGAYQDFKAAANGN